MQRGDSRTMAELFTVLGLTTALLLVLTRWLEDR